MDKFSAKDGHFYLNNQPEFIQAGEFHYFRTPKDQWQQRLGLLKNAGFNTLATYIPWIWHQLQEDSFDFDGHSHPMRDLEGFLDLAANMDFFIIPRPGPYIMAETINEGIPPWVFTKYPQAAFISQDNKIQNVASYLQPDFLYCVKKWYQEIFKVLVPRQITEGGKIIMIQLDNEMGMIAWVRNIMDINPDTMSRFATYLQATYGKDLDVRYPSTNLEAFLADNIKNPTESHARNIADDYKRFYREYLRDYAAFLWSEAKANGMIVPPVINIHGFANGGKTFPIGISQLVQVMEIDGMLSATDVYPGVIGEGSFHQLLMVNEMTKALQNKDQPLFSIEFQAGGNLDFSNNQASLYDLHTRLCISSGMRAINHYLFCDGENDPILSPVKRHDWGHPVRKDGTVRSHYPRYGKLSKVLKAYGTDLVRAKQKTVTTIGFILDHFMTEVNNAQTKAESDIITHQREVILFDMIARGLALTHRPFNMIELQRGKLNVEETPVLWVMMEKKCDAEVQQKLVDYVTGGGKLILAGRLCAQDFHSNNCTILQEGLGITKINSDPGFISTSIKVFGYKDIPVSFLEYYRGEVDEVVAATYSGEIVGFIKTIGKGKVLLFGAALAVNTLDELDIVEQMAAKMDCQPLFTLSNWADIRICQEKNGNFLFVNNYQDDPVDTKIESGNLPLFGGKPVHIPARQGVILPINWQLDQGVLIHFITAEITEIIRAASVIEIRLSQNEFAAEITLAGYYCESPTPIQLAAGGQRIEVSGTDGVILLKKTAE